MAKEKVCVICGSPRPPHYWYCARCKKIIGNKAMAERAAALKVAWNGERQGFFCFYTGVKLDDRAKAGPWGLTFDHFIPKWKGTLVVCAGVINSMKTSLSGDEFWSVVMEYGSHRKGAPFHRDVCDFQFWNRLAEDGPDQTPWTVRQADGKGGECAICGWETRRGLMYCPRCLRKHPSVTGRKDAMIESWSGAKQAFLDHYLGLELEEKDVNSPFYTAFDHRIPEKRGDLVLTSMLVNSMKTNLSEEEFNLIMEELARCREGKPFDKDVIRFEYWRRPVYLTKKR